MSQQRILLIGAVGQVGWELFRCAQPLGRVIAVDKDQCEEGHGFIDLTDADSIRSVVREVKPAVILNAAAYTAVDQSEKEPELAHAINATAVGILAEEAKRLNAWLIHYSTDYVFDGKQTRPYKEEDAVNPLGVYGKTKLAGEQAMQSVGGRYLILRTAWVYGLRGKNFLLTIQRLARERPELRVVADQIGAPTWSRMIAEATVQITTQLLSPFCKGCKENIDKLSGLYHLTCGGQTSWYDFARAVVERMEVCPEVIPITTAEYPTPVQRPAYSVLDNQKLNQTFGIRLPDWDSALELCLLSKG